MKKRLDENCFAMPDNEEDKWKELYDWLIDNGFRETINPDKDNYLSHWIKRETLTPLMGWNYYVSTYFEPALQELFRGDKEQPGQPGSPISIEGYNAFAKWDVWKAGYVERLGFVDEPTSSEYGCSLFLNSWFARGHAQNPVRVSKFYELVNDERWSGGHVATWDYVEPGTKVLGSSLSFQTVNNGENTIGSLVNLGALLGKTIDAGALRVRFKNYIDSHTGRYEISDDEIYKFLTTNFYHYNTYERPSDLDNVKEALTNHRGVYARIITEVGDSATTSHNSYSDVLVIDYNWLKMSFVYIGPVSGGLGEIKENDIIDGNIKVRFYIVDKD